MNGDTRQFNVPFLKVALALSYMNGPKIDSWARHKRQWLKDQRAFGVSMMDNSLWNDFEADFRAAYTDHDAKLTAYQQLSDLKMVGSDIDSYIAEFDRLIEEVGYNKYDMGVIQKFKEGLQPSLVREVLTHIVPAPTTLALWRQKARERQTVYKELKNAGLNRNTPAGPTATQNKWAQKLGLTNYRTPAQRAANPVFRPQNSSAQNWRNQVVPMDVDAGKVGEVAGNPKRGSHTNSRFAPLTEAERADLMAKRACFRCRKPGHLSRDCYSRRGQEQVATGTTTPEPPSRESGPQTKESKTESFQKLGGFKGVFELLKETGSKQEKEQFADMMADF